MPQNAEKFLDIFNHIEKHLKAKYNNGIYLPFHDLIRKASEKGGVVKRYRKDLYTYADLRNLMVHNSRINGRIIAEPVNEVVENIERIWAQIQHPEKVSKFMKKVFYCFTDDKLSKALDFIRENKISQIPILEKGKIVNILNGVHIAEWLAAKDIVSPSETTISEVLQMAERSGNFEIISGNMSVFDVAEIYKNSYLKAPTNWYYDALIITPTGEANDQMTGIIVLKDIAEYITS
ncbi:MAG: CBS domain-containing protein [Bacteroidales bacterium]|jgi:predicted transcriptional regulator|nr:CBS domain-containing protein [Bacteroidales bacterium]